MNIPGVYIYDSQFFPCQPVDLSQVWCYQFSTRLVAPSAHLNRWTIDLSSVLDLRQLRNQPIPTLQLILPPPRMYLYRSAPDRDCTRGNESYWGRTLWEQVDGKWILVEDKHGDPYT